MDAIKKIAIIGNAGSGKSILSQKPHIILKLPVYHLDQYFWKQGWVKSDRFNMKLFLQKLFVITFLLTHAIEASHSKRAIVIGATSGMGREIAKLLSKEGYTVGLVGRRLHLLESLRDEIDGQTYIKQLDVTDATAREQLLELINEMGDLDLIIISISSYIDNKNDSISSQWIRKERILDVDLKGFIAVADIALNFFIQQNHGHLVGISSTSSLRGFASTPEYSAAKAAISYYMQGMRCRMKRDNINVYITDVIPGYVAVEHSPLGQDPNAYWEITTQEAGKIIVEGIKYKKKVVYVPSKVWLLTLLRYIPDAIFYTYFNWM